MKAYKTFLGLFLISLLGGCAHSVHQVYLSDNRPYAPLDQGTVVKSQGEQFVIMGFTNNTNYIDQARNSLVSQCRDGRIAGITTQLSTSLGFFSWTNKALMQGLCSKKVN